jgi:hypothetical protein
LTKCKELLKEVASLEEENEKDLQPFPLAHVKKTDKMKQDYNVEELTKVVEAKYEAHAILPPWKRNTGLFWGMKMKNIVSR